VQVADMPDRNEPGTGTVDWARVVSTLRELGYMGAIGLEYFPTVPMDQSAELTFKTLNV
jgi:hydroxypyruvate isomerase